MNHIITYLKAHIKADFRWDLYLCTALFVAILTGINYQINLEKGIIDAYRGHPLRMVWYFMLYAVAYYGALLLWVGFNQKWALLRQPAVWVYSLFILAVLGLDGGFYSYHAWSLRLFDGQMYAYAFRCFSNLASLLTVFLPLFLFYRFFDAQRHYFYGFRPDFKNIKPYLVLLVCMVPLIAWAAFQPDFLRSYPTYRNTFAHEVLGAAEWVTIVFYELCYAFDFVATELMFRGFMIVGMAHLLGRGAILPMVVCYAALHFGKPLGETIGSIFGGYVLGIIALYSRSIWGGIVVHVGVAWLMDLAAFLVMNDE